jgi:superfamily II DNA or RNA helicase
VVDEAHHVVAAGDQGLLTLIEEVRPGTLTLGLTATPWPQGVGC